MKHQFQPSSHTTPNKKSLLRLNTKTVQYLPTWSPSKLTLHLSDQRIQPCSWRLDHSHLVALCSERAASPSANATGAWASQETSGFCHFLEVSWDRGAPKSSILMGYPWNKQFVNHLFWLSPFMEPPYTSAFDLLLFHLYIFDSQANLCLTVLCSFWRNYSL